MFKKTLSALAVACVMLVSAAAAGTIFPAEYTDIDGVTRACRQSHNTRCSQCNDTQPSYPKNPPKPANPCMQ